MSSLNLRALCPLLTAITLLSSGFTNADNLSRQQKTLYKVDFNNTKAHTQSLNNKQLKSGSVDTNNPDFKILLFTEGHALVLEPGTMGSTRLEYGETESALQNKVMELENQGIKYILCEPPATKTKNSNKNNIYKTNRNNTSSATELTHLRAMGYNCTAPHQAVLEQ